MKSVREIRLAAFAALAIALPYGLGLLGPMEEEVGKWAILVGAIGTLLWALTVVSQMAIPAVRWLAVGLMMAVALLQAPAVAGWLVFGRLSDHGALFRWPWLGVMAHAVVGFVVSYFAAWLAFARQEVTRQRHSPTTQQAERADESHLP